MSGWASDDVMAALENCANEPVHIPGQIQPNGYLLAVEIDTGVVRYCSENISDILDAPAEKIFGQTVSDLLGDEIWHDMRNASMSDRARRKYLCTWRDHALFASQSNDYTILEIENPAVQTPAFDQLNEQAFLLDQMKKADDEVELFDLTTRLLRHVTGFDRVMIYRFDDQWNGEVAAESRVSTVEPFLGLRFPHWDIPAQARAIMQQIELRWISDVDQVPVPVLQETSDLPPLDMTLAEMRSVSPVQLQYLRNMGIAATLTLSVILKGRLWGIISFHHRKPKILSHELRQILTGGVLPVFGLKLELAQNAAALDVAGKIDAIQAKLQTQFEGEAQIGEMLQQIGPVICPVLDASGVIILSDKETHSYGETPSDDAVIELSRQVHPDGRPFCTNSFAKDCPELADTLGQGGALAISQDPDRMLLIFRPEISQTLQWAGDPEKKIETVDGLKRLMPRGSFKSYLEEKQGFCKTWSPQDKRLASQLWPLLSALERQEYMRRVSRQQNLLIGELNHRVRNILALVKSVSTQARKEGGSLDSFGQALEARIYALAAAHNIGTGEAISAVSFAKIVSLETDPFGDADKSHVRLSGPDFWINAEYAPIFALAIHELMTNAVKYGALSHSEGTIDIETEPGSDGVAVVWREHGGPEVSTPNRQGFGTMLIRQAVPFEMDGTSDLEFLPSGVVARLWLPNKVISRSDENARELPALAPVKRRRPQYSKETVMLVEDNFMIASDLKSELKIIGFQDVELFSGVEGAMDYLDVQLPRLAVLDYSLGHDQTSEAVALRLVEAGVATFFVTGHGERIAVGPELNDIPILSKPVVRSDLEEAIHRLLD